ncbi:unnamed protein product [Effrenium voratum]|uniref:Uncharacterized protein n=1 Tax=Effrenium voratum TaxID=2562239 RepID=A0AA36I4X0_9DINO|nr:unnamed protein product [Effrenium voratum]
MAAELQQSHLRAALAENMRQIRSCEQQAKRRAASLEAGGLTSLSVKKVLAVYTLSEWQKEAALQAAQQLTTLKAEHPQYPTSALVDRMFLQADLNDLLCMFDDTNVQWEQAVRFARQMLAERGVFSWVKKQNLAHGTAPLSADVFDRLKREMRDNALPAPAPATSRGIRKAVARWRARWSVRRAKLRETDQVDPELLRQKVHMFWRTVSSVTAKCHALEQARKRSRLLKKAGGLSSSDLVWLLSRKSAAD